MFKNLSNLASMMKQATQIGGRMQQMQEQLREKRVTGAAGGGIVEVEFNGAGEMLQLTIDPACDDLQMLQDLVPAAVNQAQAKAKQLHAELMQEMTGGLNLPGLDEAISKMTGGGGPD